MIAPITSWNEPRTGVYYTWSRQGRTAHLTRPSGEVIAQWSYLYGVWFIIIQKAYYVLHVLGEVERGDSRDVHIGALGGAQTQTRDRVSHLSDTSPPVCCPRRAYTTS